MRARTAARGAAAPTPGRELRLAVLLVLAGSALLLLAAGRPWLDLVLPAPPPLPPARETRTGGDLVASLPPLGLLGLAGVAALAATRDRGRVLVGALLLGAGLAAAAVTTGALAGGVAEALAEDLRRRSVPPPAEGLTPWPYAALAGSLLLGLGGLLVASRGRRWAALSARYDAPAAREQTRPARPEVPLRPEVEAWEALDRGEDPTSGPTRERP